MRDDLQKSRAGRHTELAHDRSDRCVRLPATPESAALARDEARDWWSRVGEWERVDAVLLAVTEAIANAVLHAHPDGGAGEIVLTLRDAGDGMFEASVRDFGAGMRGAVPLPRPQLGLEVIRKLADAVDIRDARPGTIVVMRFRGR